MKKKITVNLLYYTFSQNNSGGRFIVDDNIDAYVIIQAQNPEEASVLAEKVGIYFNGVESGQDCDCCGDRWSNYLDEGTEAPQIYDKTIKKFDETKKSKVLLKDSGLDSGSRQSCVIYPYGSIK